MDISNLGQAGSDRWPVAIRSPSDQLVRIWPTAGIGALSLFATGLANVAYPPYGGSHDRETMAAVGQIRFHAPAIIPIS
jgi:hypothetical protein